MKARSMRPLTGRDPLTTTRPLPSASFLRSWRRACAAGLALCFVTVAAPAAVSTDPLREEVGRVLANAGTARGWWVVLGDLEGRFAVELARASEARLYVQTPQAQQADEVRRAAEAAGLLGARLWVQHGPWTRLHLADNLADVVIARDTAASMPRPELMRVLRPGGKLIAPGAELVKPLPPGSDDWSHPYHGPDNNPQSRDTLARAPYLTHFTAEPWYCPMPLVTVAAGGRLFKAFGHVAVKEREWPWLNTLMAQNAFNGTLLWKRPLTEGFMIHRNTLIATPTTLYLADDRSCKRIDTATGAVRDEIVVPQDLGDGPAWKWLALANDTLYALVGRAEEPDPTVKGARQARGWPWGPPLGQGYNSKTYPWGFGNTILAIDPTTKQILWTHREEAPLDARGMCLDAGRLFFYSHGRFVGALATREGNLLWKTSEAELLAAIGEHRFAQNPNEGFSSSSFAKCNDRALYFAGPTRPNLVSVSAVDGKLLWQAAGRGNSQLVLREEGLYAMGTKESTLHDFLSGKLLQSLGPRVNCTRATASADSIFVRGGRDGTIRYDLAAGQAQHLCPMRPSCQDGVLAANGHLYWGPWMCDCNLTLVGVISLAPAGDFDFDPPVKESERLEQRAGPEASVAELAVDTADWPALRANNQRNAFSSATVPAAPRLLWTFAAPTPVPATAPIAAGGLVFGAGRDGAMRALDAASGKPGWTAYTGGTITYPPALWQGRLYVGSADGWVYALEARTGRLLWRFRAAPAERLIPVYGSLHSTWPVASGVLIDQGVVYAAAGMANHDGTHVYALDATSGGLRWHNGTSGSLNPETRAGVSVNGHLLLHAGRLHLAGGNMTPLASYALADGQCLTVPQPPGSHTQFRAGSDLFVAGDEILSSGFPLYSAPGDYRVAGPIVLQTPAGNVVATPGPHDCKISLEEAGTPPKSKVRWSQRVVSQVHGLGVTRAALVVAGSHDPPGSGQAPTASVLGLNMQDGGVLWKHPLPAAPVSWGVAIDRIGRVLVSLQDGRILCYGER